LKNIRLPLITPLYNTFLNIRSLIFSFFREFGPYLFSIAIARLIHENNSLQALILNFFINFLTLNILYEYTYIVNEYFTKYEPEELRTLRWNGVSKYEVVLALITRLTLWIAIITLCEGCTSFISGIFLLLMIHIHQILPWELRSLIGITSLRLLRMIYIFGSLVSSYIEKWYLITFSFIQILPHILNYFSSKIYKMSFKEQKQFIVFNRYTFIGLRLITFYLLSTLLIMMIYICLFRVSLSIEDVIIPLVYLAYILTYELARVIIKKIKKKVNND